MSTSQPHDNAAINRAEDFLNAFNAIERELKTRTGIAAVAGFKSASNSFVTNNRWWQRDYEMIMRFADLRNVIVHERFERYAYLSIPTDEVVADI